MSRLYDGVDDDVHTLIGGNNFNGAVTLAFLAKFHSGRDGQWNAMLTALNSGGGAQGHGIARASSGKIAWLNDGGWLSSSVTTTSSADAWCLHVVTKATGSATPRYHRYKFSTTTWVHENCDASAGNPTAPGSSGLVEIGGDVGGAGDWFRGYVAAAAMWNSALSDANVESLISTFTRAGWLALSPRGLWDEIDAFSTDHTSLGGSRTSIVGTTDDADDPANWSSWAGGGGAFSLDAQPGSFALTGIAASPVSARFVNASPGTYALTGVAASPLVGRALNAQPGSFALTGVAATPLATRMLNAEPGSFALTGIATELVYVPATGAYELNAEAGVFSLTGMDASVVAARSLDAQPGSFLLTGVDAATLAGRVLNAAPGSYTLTGTEAALLAERVLAALPGEFDLTGMQANLVYSGSAAVDTGSGRIVLHLRFGPYN